MRKDKSEGRSQFLAHDFASPGYQRAGFDAVKFRFQLEDIHLHSVKLLGLFS